MPICADNRVARARAPGSVAHQSFAEVHEMAKKIRIGIVGGGHGSGYYWHEHPNCMVEAVCERDPVRREFLQ